MPKHSVNKSFLTLDATVLGTAKDFVAAPVFGTTAVFGPTTALDTTAAASNF